jgi:peptidoglycan/xylan/chitin deacetylase (PgdA/CDA1 family)
MLIIFLLIAIILSGFVLVVGRFALIEYRRDRIPILTYHRIVSLEDLSQCKRDSYVVSESQFKKHMEFLREQGFTTIDLDDYLYFRKHINELPPKPVIITFDDGYENNYTYAYPILNAFGFKAVIYAVSDPDAEEFNTFEFPEHLLSPEQMKELSRNRISIQGHTKSHAHLIFLTDDKIREELEDCKNTLESVTNKQVIHLAIPYGSYDTRVFNIARKLGYKTIAVPGNGTINLATDPYHLRRFSIHTSTTVRELEHIVASPLYAIINRLYAAGHLIIRYTLGQKFEGRLKTLFARFGLDNPKSLIAIALAVLVMTCIYILFGYFY